VDTTLNRLRETGLKASVVARGEDHLAEQQHEELVVIRADRLLGND